MTCAVPFIPVTYLFYNWKFVPLNPLPLFFWSLFLMGMAQNEKCLIQEREGNIYCWRDGLQKVRGWDQKHSCGVGLRRQLKSCFHSNRRNVKGHGYRCREVLSLVLERWWNFWFSCTKKMALGVWRILVMSSTNSNIPCIQTSCCNSVWVLSLLHILLHSLFLITFQIWVTQSRY